MRRAFLKGLVGIIAMLDENDGGVSIASGSHKGNRVADKFSCSVNGWATRSIERAALDIDDE
jgi:hypothetical protein